ncbi:MAG TPA: Tm-1-like ATP-binding domain-containing protein [Smithellaceae bacterium]|nr:Tm-1-like ATP-binding domain-containing protein [Smithellaceae bacterium]
MSGSESLKTILVIGTLDTKGEECLFIRDLILQNGCNAILIDPGPLGLPLTRGDISREDVAARAGYDLAALVETRDKGRIIQAMTDGLTAWVAELYREGRIHGAIAVGGGQGTAMGTAAMQPLPLGFPKVMVSTIASGDMRPFLRTTDIAVFPSVTDVFGLNYVFNRILENAVHALLGMVKAFSPISKGDKRVIGATAFGVVTPGLMKMKRIWGEKGFEMILFHATGTGGTVMEEMAGSGYFDGVMDWTTHEVIDEVGGGVFAPGKGRLDILARRNIPWILAPGAIDYICQGGYEHLPPRWQKRKHIIHNRNITLVRATADEMVRAAGFLAQKINRAIGPVRMMIPLRGFSEPNAVGKPFYDPEADREFIRALKQNVRQGVEILEMDAHINDDAFVLEAVNQMLEMLDKYNRRQ